MIACFKTDNLKSINLSQFKIINYHVIVAAHLSLVRFLSSSEILIKYYFCQLLLHSQKKFRR